MDVVYIIWILYIAPSSVLLLSSCEATTIIMLIILSLYEGSAAKKKKRRRFVLDYCSLEALDTNVSMVLASMTSWGRSFQSLMVLVRNEYCWYWVLQCSCKNCWLYLRCWRGGGGWSLLLTPSVAMMLLWILYSFANQAVLCYGYTYSVRWLRGLCFINVSLWLFIAHTEKSLWCILKWAHLCFYSLHYFHL